MTTNDGSTAVPDWMLERYVLGELPPAEMESVRHELARDPSLAERLAALQNDSCALLEERPPAVFGAAVRERLAGTPHQRLRSLRPLVLAAPALAAALVVGLWFGRQPAPRAMPSPSAPEPVAPATALPAPTATPSTAPLAGAPAAPARQGSATRLEKTRLKGAGPRLMLFRRTGGAVEALSPGASASSGDVVQLAYQASGARYGAILSIDGRGVVTSHVPRTGSTAAELDSGGPVTLETAYRLDDAPEFEAFYFVTSPQPFDLGPIRAAARAVASRGTAGAASPAAPPDSLPLPGPFDQASFLLRKDVSR